MDGWRVVLRFSFCADRLSAGAISADVDYTRPRGHQSAIFGCLEKDYQVNYEEHAHERCSRSLIPQRPFVVFDLFAVGQETFG